MTENAKRSLASDVRAMLIPNPLLGLVLVSVMSILVAIFIFGTEGSHKNADLSDLFRTLGVGALAAAVTGIVDHHLLFRNFESRIRDSLKEAKEMSAGLRQLGVQNAYKPFNFSRIFAEAQPGETVSWLDTYCPLQDEFLHELRNALERKVTVRMLVIEPACQNARNRNIELIGEPDSEEAFDLALANFIMRIERIAKESAGRLELRYYDDLPCVPMYILGKPKIPRKAFFSLFLSKATAHCTHMEISAGEWLDNMNTYFEQKWNRFTEKALARSTDRTM